MCSKKKDQKRSLTETFNKPEKFLPAKGHISLQPKEEEVFRVLLDAVRDLEIGTTLRVAGGWVRDKVKFCFTATSCVSHT
jgi:hypothetical protein